MLCGTRILALTSNDREIDVPRAIEAGIHGYMLLGGPVQELVDGVMALANGGSRLGHAVADRIARGVSLTSRKFEVLQLMMKGAFVEQLPVHADTLRTPVSRAICFAARCGSIRQSHSTVAKSVSSMIFFIAACTAFTALLVERST
jgi:two-component system NarL family response regulator